MYTEGTALLIFSKDKVRRAHCWRFVRIHRPNCKTTNASVSSLHFEQSFYRQLLNSGDPLQWRCLNKDLVVVLSSLHPNRNKLKGSKDFNIIEIILASHHCDLCDFAGMHDFGWWFLADLLSGHVSTIILMQKEIFFNRAFIITQSQKISYAARYRNVFYLSLL